MPKPKHTPFIPFVPESLEAMKARFPEAIEHPYDVDEIALRVELRPGMDRKHVFDFEDGIRLIISRDYERGRKPLLHFSGSVDENHIEDWKVKFGAAMQVLPTPLLRLNFFFKRTLEIFPERFFQISGIDVRKREPDHVSSGYVPHWFLKDEELPKPQPS